MKIASLAESTPNIITFSTLVLMIDRKSKTKLVIWLKIKLKKNILSRYQSKSVYNPALLPPRALIIYYDLCKVQFDVVFLYYVSSSLPVIFQTISNPSKYTEIQNKNNEINDRKRLLFTFMSFIR